MTIAHIQVDHYRIPLPTPLSDSTHGVMTHFALVCVRIRDSDGAEGVGYTYTVGDIGGSAIHALIQRDMAPLLVGEDPDRVEALWQKLWWHVHFVGRGGLAAFAQAAVDIALWDLHGKRRATPLWRLLGGHDPHVRAYAGGVDLEFTTDELLAQADGFLARGFRAIKMKVGRARLAEDVARVAAMREHLGEDFTLMVDANMGWSVTEAIRAARALRDFGLYWLEEPTLPEDVAGHARIASEGGMPIATGENFHSVVEFREMIQRGRIAFPEPDVATVGGITPWRRIAALAAAHDLPVTTHGVHDIQVHLLAAVPNASFLEIHGFGLERFLAEPLVLEEGCAVAPERPGLGVELDWDGLAAYRQTV